MADLNERQKRFCSEYIIDLNATQAAIRAKYSEKTADVMGPRLLGNVRVQEVIDKLKSDREKRTNITQDFVMQELMKIATADGTDFASVKGKRVTLVSTADLTPEKRAAIASIRKSKDGVEIKIYDKLKALELIGRHLSMFAEKSTVDVNLNQPFRVEIEVVKAIEK